MVTSVIGRDNWTDWGYLVYKRQLQDIVHTMIEC